MQKTKLMKKYLFLGGIRLLRTQGIDIVILILAISTLQFLVLALAINDPSEQANIYAAHITSEFPSTFVTQGPYIDPNTNKCYYSTSSSVRNLKPITSNVEGNIKPGQNITSTRQNVTQTTQNVTQTTVNETRPIQSVKNLTKPMNLAKNVHNMLFKVINEKNREEQALPIVNTLFNILNKKNLPIHRKFEQRPAEGNLEGTVVPTTEYHPPEQHTPTTTDVWSLEQSRK
jgi:hypothetical protein